MNRALALLAGLALATQIAAQPVAAADANTVGTTVVVRDQRPPVSPLTPPHPRPVNDTLSDVPRPDLKVEFVSRGIQDIGYDSKFSITNVGNAVAKSPQAIQGCLHTGWNDPQKTHNVYSTVPIKDLAPGQMTWVEVHCGFKDDGWTLNAASVYAQVIGDPVAGNNQAEDIYPH